MKSYIIGTAGHIDHGKSSLIKLISGTDPDRLKEEKERGITVDLGFASAIYNDTEFSFVDVPGHERLVKNMIAGASGIDAVLLAVDAREGVMPQTVEHINIIETLGVKSAVVCITKCDLADETQIDDASINADKLAEEAGISNRIILHTSINDADTAEKVLKALFETVSAIPQKSTEGAFLMRIDRAFSIKGFGTVAAGTASSGSIKTDSTVRILPADISVRIKNINIHGQKAEKLTAGRRGALNIPDADKNTAARGSIVTNSASIRSADAFYARIKVFSRLENDAQIKHNRTYPLFIGTESYQAKIILINAKSISDGRGAFARIKLDGLYTPVAGEPFVIRGLSPQITIAGGSVLTPEYLIPKSKNAADILEDLNDKNYESALGKILNLSGGAAYFDEPLQIMPSYNIDEKKFIVKKNGRTLIINRKITENKTAELIETAQNKRKLSGSMIKEITKETADEVAQIAVEQAQKTLKSKGFRPSEDGLSAEAESEFEKNARKLYEIMQNNPKVSNKTQAASALNIDEKTAENLLKNLCSRELCTNLDKKTTVTRTLKDEFLQTAKKVASETGYADVAKMKEHFDLPRKIIVPLMETLDRAGFKNIENKRYLK